MGAICCVMDQTRISHVQGKHNTPCISLACVLIFFFSHFHSCYYSDWGAQHFVFGAQRRFHLFSCDYSACIGLYAMCERTRAVMWSQTSQNVMPLESLPSMWAVPRSELKFSCLLGRHQLSHSELPKVKWFLSLKLKAFLAWF